MILLLGQIFPQFQIGPIFFNCVFELPNSVRNLNKSHNNYLLVFLVLANLKSNLFVILSFYNCNMNGCHKVRSLCKTKDLGRARMVIKVETLGRFSVNRDPIIVLLRFAHKMSL